MAATTSSVRVLKAQVDACRQALEKGGYASIQEAAEAVAKAVVEADLGTKWAVLAIQKQREDGKSPVVLYGPYATPETAIKAIQTGQMLGEIFRVMAFNAVPRTMKKG